MADYCTAAEVMRHMNKTTATADETASLNLLVTTASRAIDRACRRLDGFVAPALATARTFTGSGQPYQLIDECVAVSAVAVKDSITDTTYTAWAAADYLLACGGPDQPNFNLGRYDLLLIAPGGSYSLFTGGRYTGLKGFRRDPEPRGYSVPTVQVTARWGYAATVPEGIKLATIVQAAQWFKMGQGAFSEVLVNPEQGGLAYYNKKLDPKVRFLLEEGHFIRVLYGG